MTAVFREVLNMSLSAAFLVAIVIGLRWCFKRAPKWVHCILWALVAVRLICPSLPQSHLSMVPERVSDGQVIVQMVEEMPRFNPPPAPAAPRLEESPAPAPALDDEVPIPMEEASSPAPIPWMAILSGVWLAGMILMGIYAVFSYVRILKKVGPCVDVGSNIYLCDYIDTPFLLGFRRPRIYLPSYLTTQTAAYVLAHERAHIARRDHWWKPIGFVLLSIHWFNPMIWVGYILLCRDIEMACDEAVVKTMGAEDKKGYSSALLRCSLPRRTVSICPLAFGEVSVKERIRSVLHYKKPALWLTLVGIIAVVLGAVFFLTDPHEKVAPEDVEYLPTAVYVADRDELTITEYDNEYRPKLSINYDAGVEDIRQEYSYKRRGDKLTRTVVCTHAPYPENNDKPTSHSTSIDGVDIRPGQTVTMVYEETLDKNDNVLESVLTVDRNWFSTSTYTYNENGNVLTEIKDDLDPAGKLGQHRTTTVTYTYDALGNVLTKQNIVESDIREPSSYKQTWTRDEQGNALRFQMAYDDDEPIIDEQYTLDENGHATTHIRRDSDGSATIYGIRRVDGDACEIVTQTGADGGSTCVNFYDERENFLSTYDEDGSGNCSLVSARNYLGTDGFTSIGIPAELYTEGQRVTAHPEGYTIPMPVFEEEAVAEGPASAAFTPQSARSAILYDMETKSLISAYEPDTRLAPGSLAKIVTAFLTLETCGPDDIAAADSSAFSLLPGAPNAKIRNKEEFTIRDLAAMMLLTDANDAAVTAAEHAAGSQQAFVALMNQWVSGIGCANTEFANVTGLSNEESRTTARDLVKILNAAMKNDTFRELIGTKYYKVPATNCSEARELYTRNYMMDMQIIPDFYDDRVTGGMQGYADPYGANLICTVEDRYIAVILGAERIFAENGWAVQQYGNFEEMWSLLKQGLPASDVTFYPSASYDREASTLTLYAYDDQFRLSEKTVYVCGQETDRTAFSFVTVEPGSQDIATLDPGSNKTDYIYQQLDDQGRVTQSIRWEKYGNWHSTHQYTYDESGSLTQVLGMNPERIWRVFAMEEKPDGALGYRVQFAPALAEGPVILETNWSWGQVNGTPFTEQNCTSDIFRAFELYTHEIDQRINGMDTEFHGVASHDDSLRTESIQLTSFDGETYSQINFFDRHRNILNITTRDHDNNQNRIYFNYIGTDGSQAIGIPPEHFDSAAFSDEWAGHPDGIRFEDYSGGTYNAHVMIVRDPGSVYLGASSPTGFSRDIPGKRIGEIMEAEQALAAVNASSFFDDGTASSAVGSTPEALVYSRGTCLWENGTPPSGLKGFAGFNRDNVLIVKNENITKAQAEELDIRDGCCYGPVLIMDGKPTLEARDDHSGYNPRTAIGQRADGAVIFVCIDGRQADSVGGTYADLIEIMTKFGAVNACNLGGGSSSVMMYRDSTGIFGEAGKLAMVNKYFLTQGEPRRMPTYWMVEASQ